MNQKFAFLSTDEVFFKEYLKGQNESLTDMDFSMTEKVIEIKADDDLSLYNALTKIIEEKSIIIAERVSNLTELFTWLKIKGGSYEPVESWDTFLYENNLLDDWLAGNLTIIMGHFKKEINEESGSKRVFSQITMKLDIQEKIWAFPLLFEGDKNRTDALYNDSPYEVKNRIISVIIGNRMISANQAWLEEMLLPPKVPEYLSNIIPLNLKTGS